MLEITKAGIEGDVGIVHVESNEMQELLSKQARDMAWKSRVKMGLSNAGLEMMEITAFDSDGEEIMESTAEKVPVRWRRVFRLNPVPV